MVTSLVRKDSVGLWHKTIKESPGLYYNHIGEAQLYNTEWKLLTYIDLQEADQN
jgi:hypothetical protein